MVEKQTKMPDETHSPKPDGGKLVDLSSEPVAVDRPGFDIDRSTGKTRAGTGVGLGPDAAENARVRCLSERRGKGK